MTVGNGSFFATNVCKFSNLICMFCKHVLYILLMYRLVVKSGHRILLETNPVKLVDYLRFKLDDKTEEYINALSLILPYEDFPLMNKKQI